LSGNKINDDIFLTYFGSSIPIIYLIFGSSGSNCAKTIAGQMIFPPISRSQNKKQYLSYLSINLGNLLSTSSKTNEGFLEKLSTVSVWKCLSRFGNLISNFCCLFIFPQEPEGFLLFLEKTNRVIVWFRYGRTPGLWSHPVSRPGRKPQDK